MAPTNDQGWVGEKRSLHSKFHVCNTTTTNSCYGCGISFVGRDIIAHWMVNRSIDACVKFCDKAGYCAQKHIASYVIRYLFAGSL